MTTNRRSPCWTTQRVAVDEMDDAIVIAARGVSRRFKPARYACNLAGRPVQLRVTLERPVADRAVIDAKTGEPIGLNTPAPAGR